jgi:YggT family protein
MLFTGGNLMNALLFSLVQLIHTVINIYIWIIIISALLSFVRPDPYNPIVQTLYRLTEPVYSWVRRKMPFLIISGIDLSPLVIILGLQFLDTFMMRALLG